MKFLLFLLITAGLGYGALQFLDREPDLKKTLTRWIPSSDFHTLEIRYSAEQIMETHKEELLKTGQHKYATGETLLYPYLLMEVKYSISPKQTRESLILWDLSDGEMVLNTNGWDKTHGFGDCIAAKTSPGEFSILRVLAKKGSACERTELADTLRLDRQTLDGLIRTLQGKKLLVSSGEKCRLHLENPLIKVPPVTKMQERLVTKPGNRSKKITGRFSSSQVETFAKAAFGEDFSIKRTAKVYLPVHAVVVCNPDGSLHTGLWNALNGKKILYSCTGD